MNKPTTLVLLASLLVTGAFAQKPKSPAKPLKTIKCAVQTGNDVNIAEATKHHMYADYKGNRYFFCCDGCPQMFKAHPDKFAKNAHIKSPKPAPKKK
ncbi:MAG TPA: YHS domain-containing protein [Fimbriimonadaceae bacterium]|nr:YHS domain-containing protein [Fimbriimonadaceae bacterium]